MGGLTWLHLSDWRQQLGEFEREVVRDALIKDIEQRAKISLDLSRIDLIIFSGDVASTGRTEEYIAAKEQLFDPLLETCMLSRDRLFIVPGNHDLDRSKIPKYGSFHKLNSEDQVYSLQNDDQERKRLLKPFSAFSKFVHTYTGQNDPDYANIRKWNIDGKEVAILGINSAWMSGRCENERGSMIIGEPQIHEPLKEVSGADIKIAVFHHPLDWLDEFDRNRIEGRLLSTCNFILCGHQHNPRMKIVHSTLGNCVIVPTGGSYEGHIVGKRIYINAYNFSNLNYNTETARIFLRRWSDQYNWIEDNDSYQNGVFDFALMGLSKSKSPKIKEDFKISHLFGKLSTLENENLLIKKIMDKALNFSLKLNPEPQMIPQYLMSGSLINEFKIALISSRLILSTYYEKNFNITLDNKINGNIKKNILIESKKAAKNGAKIIILSGLPYIYIENNKLQDSLKKICRENNCFIIYIPHYESVIQDSNIKRCFIFNPLFNEPILQSDLNSNVLETSCNAPSDKSLNIFQTIYGNFAIVLGFDVFSTDLINNLRILNHIPGLFMPVDIIINPSSSIDSGISKYFCKNMSEILNSFAIFINDTSFDEDTSIFLSGEEILAEEPSKYEKGSIRFYKINLAHLNAQRYKYAHTQSRGLIGGENFYV
jgi:predicted phosphodiesterase